MNMLGNSVLTGNGSNSILLVGVILANTVEMKTCSVVR